MIPGQEIIVSLKNLNFIRQQRQILQQGLQNTISAEQMNMVAASSVVMENDSTGDELCAVCHLEMRNSGRLTQLLACRHNFHSACLVEAMTSHVIFEDQNTFFFILLLIFFLTESSLPCMSI